MSNPAGAGAANATAGVPSLGELIDQLRRLERQRQGATPASSEYIEVVGAERRLIEQIHDCIAVLDIGPTPLSRAQ